jgi:exopolyphosphatase/guanosine-5'-triphosphate,3'-diphosphate pyrophosphatase
MAKKVAVLDLGTNSFHMLLARIDTEWERVEIDRQARAFVFLGEGMEETRPPAFSEAKMEQALSVLRSFWKEGQDYGAEVWLACGTEAFRRAANGPLLLSLIRQTLGLEVRILTGAEEAHLIYEGVRHGLLLPRDKHLVVDIGGGSVEFILGEDNQILHLTSLPLGVTRLKNQFVQEDPLSPATVAAIQAHVDQTLAPFLDSIRGMTVSYLIGSSGTFKTLGRLVAHHVDDTAGAKSIHGYRFAPALFTPIYQKLLTLPLAERLRLKGMQAERAPLIPYGAIVVGRILSHLPIQTIMISGYALREGILYDYARKLFQGHDPAVLPQREAAVQALAHRYHLPLRHAEITRQWAEALFDQLVSLHRLSPTEKEWLSYAAFLHDIGHYINPSGHHKHGQYIILHSPMPGFSSEELLIISNLVRYHRKSLPSSEHFHYAVLSKGQKKVIGYLAPLLRLSDQLAKYLQEPPMHIEVSWTDEKVALVLSTTQARAALHLTAIRAEVQDFFERSYNRRLEISFRWVPRPVS